MIPVRRALATGLVVAVALVLGGCTAGGSAEPEDSLGTADRSGVAASGSAPIVFAFVCRTGDGDRTETYTTYAAVWEDDRTDCRANPITGTRMSEQQQAAVDATGGAATLEELAATCAERGVAPWRAPVETATEADVAAGLVEYCPGHPDHARLQEALTAHRG